jgi:hypothetical protein
MSIDTFHNRILLVRSQFGPFIICPSANLERPWSDRSIVNNRCCLWSNQIFGKALRESRNPTMADSLSQDEVKTPQQTTCTLCKSSDPRRGDLAVKRPRKSGRSSAGKSPDLLNILHISKRSSEENILGHETARFRYCFVDILLSRFSL